MEQNDQRCTNCSCLIYDDAGLVIQENGKDYVYCWRCEKGYQSHLEEIEIPDILIGTEKVRVREEGFPVRYNHRRYYPGAELNINPKHFNEDCFEKVI